MGNGSNGIMTNEALNSLRKLDGAQHNLLAASLLLERERRSCEMLVHHNVIDVASMVMKEYQERTLTESREGTASVGKAGKLDNFVELGRAVTKHTVQLAFANRALVIATQVLPRLCEMESKKLRVTAQLEQLRLTIAGTPLVDQQKFTTFEGAAEGARGGGHSKSTKAWKRRAVEMMKNQQQNNGTVGYTSVGDMSRMESKIERSVESAEAQLARAYEELVETKALRSDEEQLQVQEKVQDMLGTYQTAIGTEVYTPCLVVFVEGPRYLSWCPTGYLLGYI